MWGAKMQDLEKTFLYKINCQAAEIADLLNEIFKKIRQEIEESSEIEFKLEMAAREILANAIEHGCSLAAENKEDSDDLRIEVELKLKKESLSFQVRDPGPGFDWKSYDLTTMPRFEEKGRGLKMINKVADKMEFNQQGNIITIYMDF